MIERGNLLFALKRGAHAFQSRFSHDSTNFNVEDETNHDRMGKPVVCPYRGAQQFVVEDDETESELSYQKARGKPDMKVNLL